MTSGQQTALLVGGGIAALYFLMNAKPKAPVPVAGYATGTGGSTAAIVTGGAVSVIDTLTNALAGQQTGDPSSAYGYGF